MLEVELAKSDKVSHMQWTDRGTPSEETRDSDVEGGKVALMKFEAKKVLR